jgi:hypothetical protein
MTVDYLIAGVWALHVQALAMNESSGSPNVGYSDGGQARGLLGQHPAFHHDWYGQYPELFPVSDADTWWEADIKAAASFLTHYIPAIGLDLTIQAYQAGVNAVRNGARNPKYLADWDAAFNKLKGDQK